MQLELSLCDRVRTASFQRATWQNWLPPFFPLTETSQFWQVTLKFSSVLCAPLFSTPTPNFITAQSDICRRDLNADRTKEGPWPHSLPPREGPWPHSLLPRERPWPHSLLTREGPRPYLLPTRERPWPQSLPTREGQWPHLLHTIKWSWPHLLLQDRGPDLIHCTQHRDLLKRITHQRERTSAGTSSGFLPDIKRPPSCNHWLDQICTGSQLHPSIRMTV